MAEDRCIYCRQPSGDAQGVEHVIPEALGNPDWVLRKGAVCDPCNNKLGRSVDAPFLNEGAGAIRMLIGVPGKRGTSTWTLPRTARFTGDFLQSGKAGEGRVKSVQGSNIHRVNRAGLGEPEATFQGRFHLASAEVVSRFMSRVLLATVAAHLGDREALRADLEPQRQNLAAGSMPVLATPAPGDNHLVPKWTVGLLLDGVVLNLWEAISFAIRFDGSDPMEGVESEFTMDLPCGPLVQVGGPAVWPEKYLTSRYGRR